MNSEENTIYGVKVDFNIYKKIIYPDHYKLTNIDLTDLKDKAKNEKLTLITTEKDFFRLNKIERKNIKVLSFPVLVIALLINIIIISLSSFVPF